MSDWAIETNEQRVEALRDITQGIDFVREKYGEDKARQVALTLQNGCEGNFIAEDIQRMLNEARDIRKTREENEDKSIKSFTAELAEKMMNQSVYDDKWEPIINETALGLITFYADIDPTEPEFIDPYAWVDHES